MYASCAKATAAQISATNTTAATTAWRTPNALVRKVPEATMTLLYLMLDRDQDSCRNGSRL
jgi:hypothetical protein